MSAPRIPVVLMRYDDGSVVVTDLSKLDERIVIKLDELPEFVESYEQQFRPRWVWDDTTHWYPALLAAGVQVRHCADLRLRHNILRNSPRIDQTLIAGADVERWDNFVTDQINESALFTLHDTAEALDTVAEYRRQQRAIEACEASNKLQLLLTAESTAALVAAEMTFAGLPWREDVHQQLLTDALGQRPVANMRPPVLEQLNQDIRSALNAPDLNPDSPGELLKALQRAGLTLNDTRSSTLSRLTHPAVPLLLEYKKLQRLNAANGWRWLETWIHEGRFRPTYLPGGVVTGRWAATGGGALSLPAQLRPAVVADEGWTFVVADVAQLEPRVLAAMSADMAMADAARGVDLYQNMVEAHVVKTRNDAKLGMLGAMYGATQGESGHLVTRLAQAYPAAFGVVEAAARAGERGEPVETFLGRGSPTPDGEWVGATGESIQEQDNNSRNRRSWGRFTRNFIVQGTGAEWAMCWMATLRNLLTELAPEAALTERAHLVFFLHDEIIVHTPKAMAEEVVKAVEAAAKRAGQLLFGDFPIDFPLDVSVVEVYADAK